MPFLRILYRKILAELFEGIHDFISTFLSDFFLEKIGFIFHKNRDKNAHAENRK